MTVFLSHSTAALYWLSATEPPSPSQAVPFRNPESTNEQCLPLLTGLFPDVCSFEILVDKKSHKTQCITQHVSQTKLPHCSLMSLFKGVAIVSPELCFVQMATKLDLVDLVEFGFCLCGTYAYNDFYECGFCERPALTSAKALRRFINENPQLHGARKAARALRFVLDGSASPAETASIMAITCANSIGGYGLKDAHVNFRIDLSERNKAIAHRQYYIADICWPKQKVIVEYDSATFHESRKSIDSDSRRRNTLMQAGWTVITLTKQQLYSEIDMEKFVLILSKQLGKRINIRVAGFELRKMHLRERVLYSGSLKQRIQTMG
ncbi:MAG: DUF559 domain-containing protein [Eggerthellales bacterium]|nr:DUF559 domain-containing protein [Eggerthellales bacterium]